MPKRATVRFQPLQTCLINLPLSIYGQLVTRQVTPQSLVVCLSFKQHDGGISSKSKEPQRAYVGWSGMPSRLVGGVAGIGRGEEAIEMDPVCARELGIPEGAEVAIDLLRNLPAARTVNVEPVNADDWEIVELHAEYVEQNLLSQVRAASPDQIICVWVGKSRTLVRFRVEYVEPSDDIAVRLTIDTEVVVAPKTRNSVSALAKEKHNLSSSSTTPSQSIALPAEVQRAKRQLLRVLPEGVNTPELRDLLDPPQQEATAWIHPRHFHLLAQAYPSTKVSLKIKPCPGLERSSSGVSAGGATEEAEASSKVKGKGKAAREENEEQKPPSLRQSVDVHLRPSRAVPEDCLWLDRASRQALATEDQAFSLSKLGLPTGTTAQQDASDTKPVTELLVKAPPTPLAGMDKHLTKSTKHIRNTLASSRGLSAIFTSRQQTSGLLVCGASGCGKTSVVERISHSISTDAYILAHSQTVSCASLVNLRVPQLQSRLNEIFTLAAWHAPSVVIFDDLDRLIPAEMEHIDSFRSQHIANLFLNIANKATKERGIVVVATVKGPETLHASLSQSHFFGERVNLSAPDKNARKEIIEMLMRSKVEGSEELTIDNDLNYTAVSTQTEGYLPVDLKDLVDRCIHQCAIRAGKEGSPGLILSMKDVNAAQADFTPLSLRDIKLQKSEVQWSDIGGLQETRRVLRETLEWPTKYSAIFASSPLRLRSGLLLYGFPGCGKTLLASAVAKECGLNFISVKGPEILNKYIGASEKSVRDLFERAQAARPCVLFFDEFDSIAPKRGHDSTGVTDRVVNQMLTQMDGAEGLEGVYVLAATSRPDLIDPALLRPGRLDKSLLCDMPDSQDRLEIMQACSRKIALSPEIDLNDYLEETAGYSGADLQAVIYNAHLECIHNTISASKQEGQVDGMNGSKGQEEKEIEYITFGGKKQANGQGVVSRAEKAKMTKRLEQIMQSLAPQQATVSSKAIASDRKKTLVEAHHITSALRSTRPSVPRDEITRLQRIYNEFVSARAKGGLPSGEASDEVGGRSSLM